MQAVGTMPLVAIAFDGETSLRALDNQINPVAVIGRIADPMAVSCSPALAW